MTPGVYQMSFRGLSFPEAWRFSKGPVQFLLALGLKLIGLKGAKQWLPPHECETFCEESELSDTARARLLPLVERARALGYIHGRFSRLSRNLDPNIHEAFSHLALNNDRMRSLFLACIVSQAGAEMKTSVTITGGMFRGDQDIGFVNHVQYLDGPRTSVTIRVRGLELEDTDRTMVEFMRTSTTPFRVFQSFEEMKAHSIQVDIRTWDSRIKRGLFVPEGGG